MIRRALILIALLILFEQRSLACSVAAGAEDPTGRTVGTAMVIFLLALLFASVHLALFIYRKGGNGWVFWITFALSLVIMPVSFLVMGMLAGTACGEGTIEIAGFTLAFQIAALAAQLYSWKFSARSYGVVIPRD